jgi:hypothetical protein
MRRGQCDEASATRPVRRGQCDEASATRPVGRECAAARSRRAGPSLLEYALRSMDSLWASRWLCFALRTAEAACLDKHRNRFGSHRSRHVFDRNNDRAWAGWRRRPAADAACRAARGGCERKRPCNESYIMRAASRSRRSELRLTMLSLIKPLHLALDLREACTQGDLCGGCGQHFSSTGRLFLLLMATRKRDRHFVIHSAAPGGEHSNDATVSSGSVLLRRLMRSRQCQRG